MTFFSRSLALVPVALMLGVAGLPAAENPQTITLKASLKIPEATLEPGRYKLSVEDRLQDRAIVRIEDAGGGAQHLVLTVPDSRVKAGAGTLVKYHSAEGAAQQSARAWACPGCDSPLVFVYPKAEAAQITADAGEPVMATDASYDKLPPNLSPDDMKVVTLWLLTPKEVTPDHKGQGVEGAKWADARKGTTELASAATGRKHLPKTASDTYEWALAGILLMLTGGCVRWVRRGAFLRS